jgi:hypothetical protein
MLFGTGMLLEAYRVAEIRSVDGSEPAPPEVQERFEGRVFTLHQLEARGIRIAGREVWYCTLGRDWRLTLEPAV